MTRDELFENALRRYREDDKNIIYNISMGMGKTRIGLALAKTARIRSLLVLHSRPSRDETWPTEAKIWNYDLDNVDMVLHQSLYKIDGIYDVIIIDECHLITEEVKAQLDRIRRYCNPRFVFMTGTMPDDKDKLKMIYSFANNVYEYSFMQAIQDGNATNIQINVVEVEMDDTELYPYAKNASRTELKQYLHLCRSIQFAKSEQTKQLFIQARMWFIYKSQTKQKAVKYLHERMKAQGIRHIVFVTTQEFADSLSPYVYHGSSSKTYFDQFRKSEIPHLISVKTLTTGANIPNLEHGVVMQVNQKKHNLEQIIGRLTRIESEKQLSKMFFIVLKGTMDETWFQRASEKIPSKYFRKIILTKETLNSI